MDERISRFPVPEPEDLPEDLQALFAKARERIGFVPNVFRVYSFRPERLSAWFAHYRQLHEPMANLDDAVKLTRRPLECDEADIAALRDHRLARG